MRVILVAALTLAACGSDSGSRVQRDAVVAPTGTCEVDADCDDGLPCTIDRCAEADGLRACAWSVAPERCLVNGLCAIAGEARAGSPCQVCDPSAPLTWSPAADTTACDDGSACTSGDACAAGLCVGASVSCDDGDACTRDGCDPARGCAHAIVEGLSCDDGVRCTLDDRCRADGACVGAPNACDDGDPCTTDTCTELEGCRHTPADGLACEDGDACLRSVCREGACVEEGSTDCDDHNACTIDTCDAIAGCVHLPTLSPCCIGVSSVCDDGNPCTDDLCDALTGACSYGDNAAPCDDQDPCTVGDTCTAGACTGGAADLCNDENPCTADSCNPSLPGLCLHEPVAGTCDDGVDCTTADTCDRGVCKGDPSACVCEPDLSPDGLKLSSVQIGETGDPGEGVDVDQNPNTCAPNGSCSAGVDNTLSLISGFANGPLGEAVTAGDVLLVVEVGPLAANPIEVAVYQARLAPGSEGCDFQAATCDYLVDESFLDAVTCEPIARLVGARSGDRLVAGGPGTRLPFVIPIGDSSLEVVIANLRLEVDLTLVGGEATAARGVLGGAVPKAILLAGLAQLPQDGLPVPKDALISLVENLVDNDIDTDGDGQLDAASIGVKLIAIDGRLVGVAP